MAPFLSAALTFAGTAASIAGFVAIFADNGKAFAFAAAFYSVVVSVFFVTLYLHFKKYFSFRNKDGYKRIAALLTFTCDDNKTARFEARKIIQSKSPFLSEVKYQSKWLGTGTPKNSVNGTSCAYKKNDDPDKFETNTIKIGKTLVYNETYSFSTVNECGYSDYKPIYGCKVEEPTDFIQFRILLGKKKGVPNPAVVSRRSIKSESVGTKTKVQTVDFDPLHKVYFATIDNPEVGFVYFIEWEK